jgi:acetyl esterase/lipase
MVIDATHTFAPPLDPDFLALSAAAGGGGVGTGAFDLAATRADIESALPMPLAVHAVDVDRVVIDDRTGVAVETFAPTTPGPHPVLLWFHGGGYLLGTPAMGSARMQSWAAKLGCFAVSVDYRLAPEHPFPAAHDDAVSALEWLIGSAAELGVDRERIVVAGGSAGGGIAAGLVLAARDLGLPLAGQLLLYPMLDDRQQTASSAWATPMWSRGANEYAWHAYLGDQPGEVSSYAAPARASQVTELPPTMVIVGSADRFLDEDVAYASRLMHAGIPTDLRVYAGAPHGFDVVGAGSSISAAAIADAEGWLRRRFART